MRVYTKVTIDIASGKVVDSLEYDYTGPVAHAGGGDGKSKASSQPTYVLPEILPNIGSAAQNSIIGPANGDLTTINWANGTGGYSVPKSLTDINMDRAVQQVRGGYGARGLANSGIAISGEQNAIGQLALQGQQQNQTALTNLLAAGTGSSSTSKSTQPSGMSVVCTELHRQGLLDDDTYTADCEFGRGLPTSVIEGYHLWAIPLARLMRRSWLATWLAYPIAAGWAHEMHYRLRGTGKPSIIGKLLLKFGTPVCAMLGKLTKGASWVTARKAY